VKIVVYSNIFYYYSRRSYESEKRIGDGENIPLKELGLYEMKSSFD